MTPALLPGHLFVGLPDGLNVLLHVFRSHVRPGLAGC